MKKAPRLCELWVSKTFQSSVSSSSTKCFHSCKSPKGFCRSFSSSPCDLSRIFINYSPRPLLKLLSKLLLKIKLILSQVALASKRRAEQSRKEKRREEKRRN
jgi:hypothetical protein